MVIAGLLLVLALRKPSSKEVPVEANTKAPEVDLEEEARLKQVELAKHKAGVGTLNFTLYYTRLHYTTLQCAAVTIHYSLESQYADTY